MIKVADSIFFVSLLTDLLTINNTYTKTIIKK